MEDTRNNKTETTTDISDNKGFSTRRRPLSMAEKHQRFNWMEYGKLPPQATDIEELVLGALMLEKNAVNTAVEILKEEMFYKESHLLIYRAIHKLFQDSEPIDIATVTNKLRLMGALDKVGGPFYIAQLTAKVTSAANIEFHSRIISQKFIQRELIRISTDIVKMAYEDTTDVFKLLDEAEKNLFTIAEDYLHRSAGDMESIVKTAIENIEKAIKQEGNVSGIPSGFYDIDNITAGWQPSDLIILAARPGMGKTAFALTVARNIAVDYNRAVAVFSLEMSATQLVTRLIAAEAEIDAGKLKKGTLTTAELAKLVDASGKLSKAPLFIDDTPGLSIFELRAKARRLKESKNIELIVIDYLQLMQGHTDNKGGNREQEISSISRSLKSLAKELNIPVITLSQLNRSVETRGGSKKPQLSDLRESGAIEQDADMVCFIYRPDYYGLSDDGEQEFSENYAEFIIAKHRNGALEDVKLQFIKRFAKFANHIENFELREAIAAGLADPTAPDASMRPNTGFDEGGSPGITIPSSMNDDAEPLPQDDEPDFDEPEEEQQNNNDDVPF
jgi:replicative DNA helicase